MTYAEQIGVIADRVITIVGRRAIARQLDKASAETARHHGLQQANEIRMQLGLSWSELLGIATTAT